MGTASIGDVEPLSLGKEVVCARAGGDEILVLNGAVGQTCFGQGHKHRWHYEPQGLQCEDEAGVITTVALADLGGPDGHLEMIAPMEQTTDGDPPMGRHQVVIASIPEGQYPPNCPGILDATICLDWAPLEWRLKGPLPGIGHNPVIADLDRDGTNEIVLVSPLGVVFVWEAGYTESESSFFCDPKMAWPLKLSEVSCSPLVVDIDADDCLEMVVGDETGTIHVFDLPGAASCTGVDAPWPMAAANVQRTGEYGAAGQYRVALPRIDGVRAALPSPNPFSPSVRLRYQTPYPAPVRVDVYDIAGRRIAHLYEGRPESGVHDLSWDGRDTEGHPVSSGTYYARIQIGKDALTQKLVLLK